MKIENFSLKDIIKQYVICFFVYLLYGSLFFKENKRKNELRDEVFKFLYGVCTRRIQYTLLPSSLRNHNKYVQKNKIAFMIKYQIVVSKYLPVQTQ